MAASKGDSRNSANDGDEQRADEKIRRYHEDDAGVAHTAQIQNGDDDKDSDAQPHGMRLERGHSGCQRSNAGGNAHRRGENVVRQ